MDKTANTFVRNYNNSNQFLRENEPKKMREIKQEYIASERINKINVQPLLKKLDKEIVRKIEEFHRKFVYSNPTSIYNSIVQDSRGKLPVNEKLLNDVNIYYSSMFDTNLYNLYVNSADFFVSTFFLNEDGKPAINSANFRAYEKYVYLLALLVYIFDNKNELNGKLDKDYDAVVNWMQLRYSDSLPNILEGPHTTYTNPPNFLDHYAALINSSATVSNVMEEAKISKLNLTYNELANFKFAFKNAPNTYHKNYDNARQYNIIIRDSSKLRSGVDEENNLVFDGSYLDIGDVGNEQIIAQYNSIIVQQGVEKTPPSRMLTQQLQLLFNEYSAISVSELSFRYEMFLVDLSKFDFVYLVFPEIITIERTIYNENGPGVLRIAGRFIRNDSLMRYEFVPNEECVSFIGSQTFVRGFHFYITNNLKGTNALSPNPTVIEFSKTDVFNHLLTTNLSTPNNGVQDIVVNPANISFALESIPQKLNNAYSISQFVQKLPYVPSDIRDYFNNDFVSDVSAYQTNLNQMNTNVDISVISQNSEIINRVRSAISTVLSLNNSLNKIANFSVSDISGMKAAMLAADDGMYASEINNLTTNNLTFVFQHIFNGKNADTLVAIAQAATPYISYSGNVVLKYDTINGTINGFGFVYDKNSKQLTLTNETLESNKYLPDDSNFNIVVSLYDDISMNVLPVNNYLYQQYQNIVRLLPLTTDNVYNLRNLQHDYDYVFMRNNAVNSATFDFGAPVSIFDKSLSFDDFRNTRYTAFLINDLLGELTFGLNYPLELKPSFNINIAARNQETLFTADFYESDGKFITTLSIDKSFNLSFSNESNYFTFENNVLTYQNGNASFVMEIVPGKGFFITSITPAFAGAAGASITKGTNAPIVYAPSMEDEINATIMGGYIDDEGAYHVINTNSYSYVYNSKNDIETSINENALFYSDANLFKTYTVAENMLTRFFNRTSYIAGIVINPLPFPAYKTEEVLSDYITENRNLTTVIYSFDSKRPYINGTIVNEENANKGIEKRFYETLLASQTQPNILFVDNEQTDEEVFVYKSENYILTNTNIVQETASMTITLSDNTSVVLTIENHQISSAEITYKTASLSLTGPLVSGRNYIVPYQLTNGAMETGLILFSVNTTYDSSNQLWITGITLNLIYSTLYSYEWRNGKLYKNHYYHMITNPGFVLYSNANVNSNPLSLYWILKEFEHPIIPIVRYYQNNLNSLKFADADSLVQMTINTASKVNNNQRVVLKNELATTIPSDEIYIAETVDNKLVIDGVENYDKNIDNFAIKPNAGSVVLSDNNNINISLNFK